MESQDLGSRRGMTRRENSVDGETRGRIRKTERPVKRKRKIENQEEG